MAGFKDHTDIFPDNILKLAVESLMADEQQQYEDYMRHVKERPTSHLFYLCFKYPT
jgi:hypothetical protein